MTDDDIYYHMLQTGQITLKEYLKTQELPSETINRVKEAIENHQATKRIKQMSVGTKFPPEWLLKKSREECAELRNENSLLRQENWEMKQRIMEFTSRHEAKIAAHKEELYKAIIQQKTAFESKYSKARKVIADIHKIASNASESSDAVAYLDDICNTIINYYATNRK